MHTPNTKFYVVTHNHVVEEINHMEVYFSVGSVIYHQYADHENREIKHFKVVECADKEEAATMAEEMTIADLYLNNLYECIYYSRDEIQALSYYFCSLESLNAIKQDQYIFDYNEIKDLLNQEKVDLIMNYPDINTKQQMFEIYCGQYEEVNGVPFKLETKLAANYKNFNWRNLC